MEGFAPLFIYGGVIMGLTAFNRIRRAEADKKAKEVKAPKKPKKEK